MGRLDEIGGFPSIIVQQGCLTSEIAYLQAHVAQVDGAYAL